MPSLRTIFRSTRDYAYEHVRAADNDECLICREPYAKRSAKNTKEGCHAIRLTHCGHTIGLECFGDWVARLTDTCPYWSHDLPRSKSNSTIGLLEHICNSFWFSSIEDAIAEVLAPFPDLDLALCNLGTNRLTIADAGFILHWYLFVFFAIDLAAGLIIYVVIKAAHSVLEGLFLTWNFCAPSTLFLPSSAVAYLIEMVIAGNKAVLAVHSGLFVLVVFGVLLLGLWRSFAEGRKCR
jgi:hypothetical protein